MGVGLSSGDWSNLAQEYVAQKTRGNYYAQNANGNAAQTRQMTQKPQTVSQANYCTDGIDDGKIGFLSAAGNVIEGAGKGIVNGIKGMFTDKNGNFSLLKTAGTLALGAACIAFPAAGLVMCGIGVASGGTKFVKGISTALSATSDAQAKDAWEAVGDGALTTAVSIAGVKASYGAVVKSAGASSEIAAMKNAGTWKEATLLRKASALSKDMISSTKNNFGKIKTSLTNTKEALEIQKLRNSADKVIEQNADKPLDFNRTVEANKTSINAVDKANSIANKNPDALELANKWQTRTDASQAARATLKDASTKLSDAKKALQAAKKAATKENDNKAAIEAAEAVVKSAKAALKTAKNDVGLRSVTTNIGSRLAETQTVQHLRTIKTVKSAFSKANFQSLLKSMSADGQAIINFLRNENGVANESVYQQAVDKFGYENVAKALEVFASYRLIDETV